MKITDVKTYQMRLPTDSWMLVAVETDENYIGWGDVTGSCDDDALAGMLERMKMSLIGKNPLHILACTQALYEWTYPVLNNIRTNATALSGLDQALWDLSAKHYKIPLYKLLGGDGRSRVLLYANMNKALRGDRSIESLQNNTKLAVDSGFQMFKCTPFDNINPTNAMNDQEKSFLRLGAMAELVPIEQIAIDCHQRFERYSLSRMIERLQNEYGQPYWVEDPVDVLDYKTMEVMQQRYPSVRWAAGEDAFTCKQLFATMKSGYYEVLMPDVKYIGGVSAVRSIIPFAEGAGFKVSMHNPNGIIATAHSAHLSTLSRSGMPMEYPFAAVANRELLCTPSELIKDGYYHFSQEPGIGVELTQHALLEYGFQYHRGQWNRYTK